MNDRHGTNFFWRTGSTIRSWARGACHPGSGYLAAFAITLLALGSALAGCGKPVEARVQGSLMAGEMKGRIYTNYSFGFSLAVPAGWSVDSSSANKTSKSASPEPLQLLRVSEKPIGARGGSNPTLLVLAEPCPSPKEAMAREYLEKITGLLDGATIRQADSVVPYAKEGEIRETRVGGRTFYRADLTARVGNQPVRQCYFSTVANGHVLSLIIAGLSETEIRRLEAIVASAVFAPR